MSAIFKKLKLENNICKEFCDGDKINIYKDLTNDITNVRKFFNSFDNDGLSYFVETQQEFYSDNYNNGLEKDRQMKTE